MCRHALHCPPTAKSSLDCNHELKCGLDNIIVNHLLPDRHTSACSHCWYPKGDSSCDVATIFIRFLSEALVAVKAATVYCKSCQTHPLHTCQVAGTTSATHRGKNRGN